MQRQPRRPAGPSRGTSIRRRRGAALITAIFIMAVTTALVIGIMDTQMLEYAALRNTTNFDRSSYLAAAGIYHALAELEQDISWRNGVPSTEFPAGSGNTYSATAQDGPSDTIIVSGTGTAEGCVRRLEITLKAGG